MVSVSSMLVFSFLWLFIESIGADEVRLIDLDPAVAQQYIDQQDTSLNYAPKIESAVPAIRFLGEEPYHVLEDKYNANQYHGQDGLGSYVYGYAVPDIAKTERKKADGDVHGAYKYVLANGEEINVKYWADKTGFHQTDNVAEVLPGPVDYTDEQKKVRDAFFEQWNLEAERNSKPVQDPHGNVAEGSEKKEKIVKYDEGKAEDGEDDGQYDPKKYEDEDEETGPPKGFFYSFTYPVGIIVDKQGKANIQHGEANNRDKGLHDVQVKELTTRKPK